MAKKRTAYQKLLDHFGSDVAMAEAFGVKRQAISYWKENGVPAKRAKDVAKVTNGAVSAIEILEG